MLESHFGTIKKQYLDFPNGTLLLQQIEHLPQIPEVKLGSTAADSRSLDVVLQSACRGLSLRYFGIVKFGLVACARQYGSRLTTPLQLTMACGRRTHFTTAEEGAQQQ